ncbi:MAG: hypothetical protein H6835_04480 [Planctomycetes bacterium]|nr:hypothetical protein [Planctomycetota bacterium]
MTPLSRTFRAAALLLGASLAAQGTPTLLVDVEALAPDNPGAFSQPGRMSGLTWGSYLDFAADADGTGSELWRTDGTAAVTWLHAELQPGALGSWPGRPARAGAQLLLAATQTEAPAQPIGREPFALPVMACAEPVGNPCSLDPATAPLARGDGTPSLGDATFALHLDAAPSSIALLVLGDPVDVALAPCELRVANITPPLVLLTDANGAASVPLPIPAAPAFAGLRVGAQWAVLETGGPLLGFAAASNGVDLVLQSQCAA